MDTIGKVGTIKVGIMRATQMANEKIWARSARLVVDDLERQALRPDDVLTALLDRIKVVNPIVNSLPTLCTERAFDRYERVNEAGVKDTPGPLFGLPVPIKDSYRVESVRTTWGSLAFKNHIPAHSDYAVEAIERAGGVIYAKSNTPEFEVGASTFNEIFGKTLNPWNTAHSAAGSSGGAAAAVATGMAFIAQGSDFACSLRYPASFCGVVGLRPTPGLIPQGPGVLPYQTLSVIGPLARNVADLGLGLDAMAGFDVRDPLTSPCRKQLYRQAAEKPVKPERFAWSSDLGIAVISSDVRKIVGGAIEKLAEGGCAISESHPDLSTCHRAFRALRAFQFSAIWSDILAEARDVLKPEVVWNIEEGIKLSAKDLARAEKDRSRLRYSMVAFLERHKFLITPTAPVAPNPVQERYVTNIEGIEMESYLDWLALGYAVTITGCPAISVPCGFTKAGLPVGLQIIASPFEECALISCAAWVEEMLAVGLQVPIDPVMAAS